MTDSAATRNLSTMEEYREMARRPLEADHVEHEESTITLASTDSSRRVQ
jgi:hypothetical protein